MEKRRFIRASLSLAIIVAVITCCIVFSTNSEEEEENEQPYVERSYSDLVKSHPELYLMDAVGTDKLDTIIKILEEDNTMHVVTATVYNPVPKQCDNSPLITADCSKIDLEKLNKGELKWIAISRELREYYPYGSKVQLTCLDNPKINGIYEVHDTMNKRYNRYIDILVPCDIKYGKWTNVIIERV